MVGKTENFYIDVSLFHDILSINIPNTILLFAIAYLLFVTTPRFIFPQRYAGGGIENIISNILYMLAFIELAVPLLILLKIFNVFTFIFMLFALKLFFIKLIYKESITLYFLRLKRRLLSLLYDFIDNYQNKIQSYFLRKKNELLLTIKHFSYYIFFKKVLIFAIFAHLIYIIGYRCFISMANPLPDTSQFVEWVAMLEKNELYWDNKTAGADFYGIAVLIFILHTFTQIDTIVLFNIYPLLLITFLFFGVYFVLKRFSTSSLIALAVLLVYGSVFLGSPWDEYIASKIVDTKNPDIISFLGFSIYNISKEHLQMYGSDTVAIYPLIRYFSGMAYEHASTFFLINLFYLIKALDTQKSRYLINYTLTLMLVFIFHGGGAIALLVSSLLIALHATVSFKLTWSLLRRGLGAIGIATILGNGWILSMLKYGLPQDIGAAAPFLDQLLQNKSAVERIVETSIESVTIPYINWIHVIGLSLTIFFFLVSFMQKKRFYFSSFLLIPLGTFIFYFAQNLGLPELAHPRRAIEYFYLGMTIVVACILKFFLYNPLKLFFAKQYKKIFLIFVYTLLLFSFFVVPHYKNSDKYREFINSIQYSDIPFFLYKIIRANDPLTWTVVSYVQEYSKVLGKGYIVLANEFLLKYSPTDKYLKIPTKKVYIMIEHIPHRYQGTDQWYYRWRHDIETQLNNWVAIYAATHKNIKIFGKSKLVTVYEIDNSEYVQFLQSQSKE